ncbi:MAG TPA: alpha/beta hydrolase [Stellaceae bacterium]|nr:alpha/beta hydrolase [Stellaceae bacterium]
MLHRRVNGHDMAYIEVGEGSPLVCVHGSLGDFRVWFPVLGPLSHRHRVITPSLRRFFPEHWDGKGEGFTIAQHLADLIAFVEGVGGKVDLLGHSRGGHLAFRVAQQRPDLLRRLILAEPGGELDGTLATSAEAALPSRSARVAAAAEKIAAGEIDAGLALFVDGINGAGAWRQLPASQQQRLRDNARTLLGQINEGRRPYGRAEAEAIRVPTLFIGGEQTPGLLPIILRTLAAHVPGARVAIIPNTTHSMFYQDPVRFSAIVLDFLASG